MRPWPTQGRIGFGRKRKRTDEELAKIESRNEQGWQRRQPLTITEATHSADGRPYVRDQHGTIRKGRRR